jgi:tripartite-type tricarboxylate transporter receptor subunit TctC
VSASGLPGYESVSPFGIFAPAKCPAVLIARLNHELVRVLSSAETTEKFFNAGVETVGSSPAQLAATMNSEMAKWGKLIRDAGIREQ